MPKSILLGVSAFRCVIQLLENTAAERPAAHQQGVAVWLLDDPADARHVLCSVSEDHQV